MNTLLDKPTLENKPSVISGDFNLNLIKYTQNRGVNQVLENILSNSFIPHIALLKTVVKKPTICKHIYNIFTNNYKINCVLSNITTYISDHNFWLLKTLNKIPAKKSLPSASDTTKASVALLLKQNLVNLIGYW